METTPTLPEPFRPEWRILAGFLLLLLFAAWLFFDTIEDFYEADPLASMDKTVFIGLQALRSPSFDWIMIAITELGDTPVVVSVTLGVAFWLTRQKAWRTLALWLIAVAGGSGLNTAIKIGLQRARPSDLDYLGASVFSFPSGHSTSNAVLYGFLLIVILRQIAPKWRIAVAVTGLSFIGLIAFSRLYLGAHWLSDVIGGLAFGSLWLSVLGLFYMWRRAEAIEPIKLIWVVLATLMVAGTLHIGLNHLSDTQRYAVNRAHNPSPNPQPKPAS